MKRYVCVSLGVYHCGRVQFARGYWALKDEYMADRNPELHEPIRGAVSDWLDWYAEVMQLDRPIGVSVNCVAFWLPDCVAASLDNIIDEDAADAAARFVWSETYEGVG